MTPRESRTFINDVQRREEAYLEEGKLSGEECHIQAREDAEMAFDEYQDSIHEDRKDQEREER